VKILRYFQALLLCFIITLTSCYTPTSPDIFGVHISCHFNGSYDDYMWIFQVWVDHPIQLQDVREVEVFLYNAYGEMSYFSLRPDGKYLWNDIAIEQNTNLTCGRWYDVDVLATDYYGSTDNLQSYYQ